MQDLFTHIAETEEGSLQYMITLSYLEIYNEIVRDLLNPSDEELRIKTHPKLGVYVERLADLVVKNPEDVFNLLDQGDRVRAITATGMNSTARAPTPSSPSPSSKSTSSPMAVPSPCAPRSTWSTSPARSACRAPAPPASS